MYLYNHTQASGDFIVSNYSCYQLFLLAKSTMKIFMHTVIECFSILVIVNM